MRRLFGIEGRGAWLLAALLATGPASSCSLIVDADQYTFTEPCPIGSEGCRCDAVGKCSTGLECRLPGFCVDPGSANRADAGPGASAGASAGP